MTSAIVKKISTVAFSICFLIASNAAAEEAQLCMDKEGTLSLNSQCYESGQQLNVRELGDLLERQDDCGRCSDGISGKWKFAVWSEGEQYRVRTVVFNQAGKKFKGVNSYYTMVGSVEGNVLTFVMVVTGETLEGWVAKVTAAVDGNKIYGVVEESNGTHASFTAWR